MESQYLRFSLRMINLWIGLCNGDRGLPLVIRELGYRPFAVERPFANSEQRKVCPDIIVYSLPLKHSMVCEMKDGGNIEEAQHARYMAVRPEDLVQRAMMEPEAAQTHDVCYHVPADKAAQSAKAMLEFGEGMHASVVAFGRGKLQLVCGELSVSAVNSCLKRGLEIPEEAVPEGYIPIDADSSLHEVAAAVLPVLVAKALDGKSGIPLIDLCDATCREWGLLGTDGRNQYAARVRGLGPLVAKDLSQWFGWSANQFVLRQAVWQGTPAKQSK